MIVIGIDSHKDILVCALVDHQGRLVEPRGFANTPKGHNRLVCWTKDTNTDRVAIEGSGNYGRPVALALLEAGIETVEVPPQMTARARRRQRTGTKTDHTDALLIARIGARDHDLPTPPPHGAIEDLRCLVFHRRELVKTRTQGISGLHTDLEQLHSRLPPQTPHPHSLTQDPNLSYRTYSEETPPPALRWPHKRIHHIRTPNRQIDKNHHPDRRPGQNVRYHPHRRLRRRSPSRGPDPHRSRQSPQVYDQRQVRHGQQHRTH